MVPTEQDFMDQEFEVRASDEGQFIVYCPTGDWNIAGQFRASPHFQWDAPKRGFAGAIAKDTVDFLEQFSALVWHESAEKAKQFIKIRQIFYDRANEIKEHFLKTGKLQPKYELEAPFKTKPYTHQMVALSASINQPGMALLMEMGTGKTKVSIDRACYELLHSDVKWYRMIIVAPKSILINWEQEFEKHCWLPYQVKVLQGSTDAKADQIMQTFIPEATKLCEKHDRLLSALVVNYESLYKLTYLIGILVPDLVIFDETSQVKNPSAKRTKAAIQVRELCRQGMILNGTAISKSPLDLWSQFELTEKGALGFKSFNAFKRRYSWMVDRYQSEPQNIPELKNKIAKASFIITKKDCLDLPERIYTRRHVEMTNEQKLAYIQLKEELLIEINCYVKDARARGENPAIIANHVLTQMLRLEQVTSGYIQDKSQQFKHHFDPNPKTVELNEMLEQVEGKVIVWCRFIENILHLEKNLNGTCCTLYGNTKTEERQAIVNDFNSTSNKRIIVAHPQVAGFGLNIIGTEEEPVNTVVRYSHDFNYTWVKQSDDRAHRVGMHSQKLTYVDLVVPSSIDTYILKNLAAKEAVAGEFKNPQEMLNVEQLFGAI